jgi:hypothetical protein
LKQVWRNIEGCPGYQVSSMGRVRSPKIILQPVTDSDGYVCVSLPTGKKRIHILVARAFLPNPNQHPIVNHKDGNKRNNTVSNLEWCDNDYNMRHAAETGLMASGERHGLAELSAAKVSMINSLYREGKTQAELARMFKVNQSTISRVLNKKTWRR